MPRGDKSKYTDKQKRKAEHIEEGYEKRGVSEKEAERRAWATVNKSTHGGKKPGVGTATASAAGAAIMRRFVRVIEAGRPVAQDHDQTGKSTHQACRTQNTRDPFSFFFGVEAGQ